MAPLLPEGFSARRIDYREARHEDLAKIHLIETEVESERRPDRKSLPVEQYIVEARAFPAYFHEWTWLVEDSAGTAVATAAAWYREGADPDWLEADLWVREPWRRRGIASHLLGLIADVASAEDRSRLLGSTTDKAPAGEAFARRVGAVPGRVNRSSELTLDRVDWEMVRRWVQEGPARAPGYSLEFVAGPYPESHWDDAVSLRSIMNTAPLDDLDIDDRQYSREQVAQDDAWLLQPGKSRWTYFARHLASGTCVGGTNVYLSAHDPEMIGQGDTGVHPDHRGHALGKWLKAAMLERIRADAPDAKVVHTGNAYSNAPMLGINDALGFVITRTGTEWKVDLDVVRAAMAR